MGAPAAATSRGPDGQCIPDCPEGMPFPWSIKVNGQAAHTAQRQPHLGADPETGRGRALDLKNGGGGWDHPIHLHFEEGVTIDRGGNPIPSTERLVRKDVWRLRPGGEVKLQVRFGEFGGAYVNHCHNTAHEDFAMLLRMQVLAAHPDQGVRRLSTTSPRLRSRRSTASCGRTPRSSPKANRAREPSPAVPDPGEAWRRRRRR